MLITITGPIAAGKNTVAELAAELLVDRGRSVVIADVDDVAAMVLGEGAGAVGLWFAAHRAHGALVAEWLRTDVDVVIAVGPFYPEAEQEVIEQAAPDGVRVLRVIVEAPMEVTWPRAVANDTRGLSRQRDFHVSAYERYRTLRPAIPADLVFDSSQQGAAAIAAEIVAAAGQPVIST